MDCVSLKQSDRMPVAFFQTFWLAKYGGISCREAMYDYEKVAEIAERACLELDPDLATPVMMTTSIGRVLDGVGFRQLQWPGHGVDDNRSYQYLDREYMSGEEYDEFLFDPTGFFLGKYLPRVATAYDGLQPLAALATQIYFGVAIGAAAFASPPVQGSLAALGRAGGISAEFLGAAARLDHRLRCLGFPSGMGGYCTAPYDHVADYMRGARGMMTDLYRKPDKLHAVFEKVKTLALRGAIPQAQASGNPLVFIAIHWAPDAFMSQKQFLQFWWPSFRELLHGLIGAGLIPMVLWEADCTKRLEVIGDIPRGKCIYWFERTDMVRAFEVLGDVVALRGNVSAVTLNTGRPEDVDAEVRRLVENVWNKGGSLILDAAAGIPDEAPIENVRAMFVAARKYSG